MGHRARRRQAGGRLIDRVVHHGRLVEFGGASRRMEEALMLGKGGADAA